MGTATGQRSTPASPGTPGPTVVPTRLPRHQLARLTRTEVLWWAGMRRPGPEIEGGPDPDGMECSTDDTDSNGDGDDDDEAPSSPVFNRKQSSKRKRSGPPASQQQHPAPAESGGSSEVTAPAPLPAATATHRLGTPTAAATAPATIASFMSAWSAPACWPADAPYFWAEAGEPLTPNAGGRGGPHDSSAHACGPLRWGDGYFADGSFERMLRPTPTPVGAAPGRTDGVDGRGGGGARDATARKTPRTTQPNAARTTPISLFGVRMSATNAKALILPFRLVRSFFCLGATAAAWATAAGSATCWQCAVDTQLFGRYLNGGLVRELRALDAAARAAGIRLATVQLAIHMRCLSEIRLVSVYDALAPSPAQTLVFGCLLDARWAALSCLHRLEGLATEAHEAASIRVAFADGAKRLLADLATLFLVARSRLYKPPAETVSGAPLHTSQMLEELWAMTLLLLNHRHEALPGAGSGWGILKQAVEEVLQITPGFTLGQVTLNGKVRQLRHYYYF